jgi:hypothetical protein
LGLDHGQVFSFFLGCIAPAFVLLLQTLLILQEVTDFLPDVLFQPIGSHLTVITNSLSTKAISVGTNTAIVGIVAFFAFGSLRANGLPVVSLTALGANQQSLEQIPRPALALAGALAVLLQLMLNSFEHIFVDQGRHWDQDPFCGRSVIGRDASPGLQETPVLSS